MAEYVNKAKLMRKLKKLSTEAYQFNFESKMETTINTCIDVVDEMPTTEIVPCKACKYWSLEKELTRLNGEQYTVGYCCLEDKYSDCDWFCADGERRG